jgi:hypothetical protein
MACPWWPTRRAAAGRSRLATHRPQPAGTARAGGPRHRCGDDLQRVPGALRRRPRRHATCLGLTKADRLVLHPVRAIPRKNIPAAIALTEAVGATYRVTGPAEDGYGPELDRVLAAARWPRATRAAAEWSDVRRLRGVRRGRLPLDPGGLRQPAHRGGILPPPGGGGPLHGGDRASLPWVSSGSTPRSRPTSKHSFRDQPSRETSWPTTTWPSPAPTSRRTGSSMTSWPSCARPGSRHRGAFSGGGPVRHGVAGAGIAAGTDAT